MWPSHAVYQDTGVGVLTLTGSNFLCLTDRMVGMECSQIVYTSSAECHKFQLTPLLSFPHPYDNVFMF